MNEIYFKPNQITVYDYISFGVLSTQGNGSNFWSDHCTFSSYSSQTQETVQYRSVNINDKYSQYLKAVIWQYKIVFMSL